jgi:hypothetical protein
MKTSSESGSSAPEYDAAVLRWIDYLPLMYDDVSKYSISNLREQVRNLPRPELRPDCQIIYTEEEKQAKKEAFTKLLERINSGEWDFDNFSTGGTISVDKVVDN